MELEEIDLYWHNYKFFPYEKKFALREVQTLLEPLDIEDKGNKVTLKSPKNTDLINELVYFSYAKNENSRIETVQHQYENTLKIDDKVRSKRQNTRYSVHGLHEYKGKFNPQVVRSLFNIFGVKADDKILDPFCGSGTTIVEAAHSGILGIGTDINPLAAMIANTKIASLNTPWEQLDAEKKHFIDCCKSSENRVSSFDESNLRIQYLKSWFPDDILIEMETMKVISRSLSQPADSIFLIIISNILRDYSLQEPSDLRIRRRKSALPSKPFIEEVEDSISLFIHNLKVFQNDFGVIKSFNKAHNLPIKEFGEKIVETDALFDFAITSPPYATALPYIDTQRLSLVWLDLIEPKRIRGLESELIGSREFKKKNDKDEWLAYLKNNEFNLPACIHDLCMELLGKLSSTDGFRKKALPTLLYRYFYEMQEAIRSVYNQLKPDKCFALIVGHNHTTIGGRRTEINTPQLLGTLGEGVGFTLHELTQLEAYQRYGLNATNAVQSESLIVFKK